MLSTRSSAFCRAHRSHGVADLDPTGGDHLGIDARTVPRTAVHPWLGTSTRSVPSGVTVQAGPDGDARLRPVRHRSATGHRHLCELLDQLGY
ncbi:MAG TPA: hypothetical protein VHN80_02435, partial [Kineosporiaceae bacterium]|nr:hypothetical protein [Kineosporiaceae bacterium]